jgi:hypothetical protein
MVFDASKQDFKLVEVQTQLKFSKKEAQKQQNLPEGEPERVVNEEAARRKTKKDSKILDSFKQTMIGLEKTHVHVTKKAESKSAAKSKAIKKATKKRDGDFDHEDNFSNDSGNEYEAYSADDGSVSSKDSVKEGIVESIAKAKRKEEEEVKKEEAKDDSSDSSIDSDLKGSDDEDEGTKKDQQFMQVGGHNKRKRE